MCRLVRSGSAKQWAQYIGGLPWLRGAFAAHQGRICAAEALHVLLVRRGCDIECQMSAPRIGSGNEQRTDDKLGVAAGGAQQPCWRRTHRGGWHSRITPRPAARHTTKIRRCQEWTVTPFPPQFAK